MSKGSERSLKNEAPLTRQEVGWAWGRNHVQIVWTLLMSTSPRSQGLVSGLIALVILELFGASATVFIAAERMA